MQVLFPRPGELLESEIAGAYPWPDTSTRAWVRACMVLTADGGLTGPDGRSRSISGPADRAVLSATRAWADAIVVGAGTLRTEGYQPVRARLGSARLAAGRLAAPRLVVLTRSGMLDWGDPIFTDSAVAPLVVTAAGGADIPQHIEQLRFPGGAVDLPLLLLRLFEMGLARITCEGGPGLLADMVDAGAIDEMDLTIAPWLAGHAAVGVTNRDSGDPETKTRTDPTSLRPLEAHVPAKPALTLTGLELVWLACKDGYIFSRYLRRS